MVNKIKSQIDKWRINRLLKIPLNPLTRHKSSSHDYGSVNGNWVRHPNKRETLNLFGVFTNKSKSHENLKYPGQTNFNYLLEKSDGKWGHRGTYLTEVEVEVPINIPYSDAAFSSQNFAANMSILFPKKRKFMTRRSIMGWEDYSSNLYLSWNDEPLLHNEQPGKLGADLILEERAVIGEWVDSSAATILNMKDRMKTIAYAKRIPSDFLHDYMIFMLEDFDMLQNNEIATYFVNSHINTVLKAGKRSLIEINEILESYKETGKLLLHPIVKENLNNHRYFMPKQNKGEAEHEHNRIKEVIKSFSDWNCEISDIKQIKKGLKKKLDCADSDPKIKFIRKERKNLWEELEYVHPSNRDCHSTSIKRF